MTPDFLLACWVLSKLGCFSQLLSLYFSLLFFSFFFSPLSYVVLCGIMGISQYYQPMYIHFNLAHILLPTLFWTFIYESLKILHILEITHLLFRI